MTRTLWYKFLEKNEKKTKNMLPINNIVLTSVDFVFCFYVLSVGGKMMLMMIDDDDGNCRHKSAAQSRFSQF